MGKVTDASLRERMIYKQVENYLKEKWGTAAKDFIISPGYLRAERNLSSTQSKYSFALKKEGNEVATEVKLDRNDLFVVSRIGFYISKQFAVSVGKEVPQTYPNIIEFPAVAGLVAADLEAVYNGFQTLKIANRTNIEALSNQEFRYVPGTQQSAASNKSENNLSDCTYKPASTIFLHGTMDIQWTTEFPSYAGISINPTDTVTNGQTKLVLIPFGFLVKGAASNK